MNSVGVVMGSDSDFDVLEATIKVLKKFDVSFEVKVSSAHRTLERTVNWVNEFEAQGGKVLIAAAGMAAHLAGVVAAATTLPVIGLPIKSGALDGVDALYATVQMPSGIPVATVGINAGKNAGLFAIQILAQTDSRLKEALKEYRQKMAAEIETKDQNIQEKVKKV